MRKIIKWFLNGLQIMCLIPVILGIIIAGIGVLLFTIVAEVNYD
jgi:hypothetical protein